MVIILMGLGLWIKANIGVAGIKCSPSWGRLWLPIGVSAGFGHRYRAVSRIIIYFGYNALSVSGGERLRKLAAIGSIRCMIPWPHLE
jgi:hypothetical protein